MLVYTLFLWYDIIREFVMNIISKFEDDHVYVKFW